MEKNKLLPLAIIILSISLVFSSLWIGQSLKEAANKSISAASQQSDILGVEEAAKYLSIDKSELLYLAEEKGSTLNYVKINGKYIFSKEGLNKWVQSTKLEVQQ